MSSAPRLPRLCLFWIVFSCACAAQHGPRKAGGTDEDAVITPPANALRQLVHDVFTEIEHDAELRCPCYVADGTYPNEDDCLAEVGRGARSIDCIEEALGDAEDAALRAALECALKLRRTSNACLKAASCEEQLTLCYASSDECPPFDPALLTQAARSCPGAIGVFR